MAVVLHWRNMRRAAMEPAWCLGEFTFWRPGATASSTSPISSTCHYSRDSDFLGGSTNEDWFGSMFRTVIEGFDMMGRYGKSMLTDVPYRPIALSAQISMLFLWIDEEVQEVSGLARRSR